MALGKRSQHHRTAGPGASVGADSGGVPNLGGQGKIEPIVPVQKYDPAEFIIPGQDAHGHSERIYCRVQPSIAMHIGRVVSDHKFPFRTQGDLIRWSVWTGIKLLESMEPTPNTFLNRSEAVHALLREEIYQQEYLATLDTIQKVVQQYLSMGAEGEAAKVVAKVKVQWEKIEEKYWREKCLTELMTRFGHLLRTKGAATLTGTGTEGESEG